MQSSAEKSAFYRNCKFGKLKRPLGRTPVSWLSLTFLCPKYKNVKWFETGCVNGCNCAQKLQFDKAAQFKYFFSD